METKETTQDTVLTSCKVCTKWQASSEVDVDLSCIAFDKNGTFCDAAFYNKPSAVNGSVEHSGDAGQVCVENFELMEGIQLQETIEINLENEDPKVNVLAIVVSNYGGKPLKSAHMSIEMTVSGNAKPDKIPDFGGDHSALILGLIHRREEESSCWMYRMLGTPVSQSLDFTDTIPVVLKSMVAEGLAQAESLDKFTWNEEFFDSFPNFKKPAFSVPKKTKELSMSSNYGVNGAFGALVFNQDRSAADLRKNHLSGTSFTFPMEALTPQDHTVLLFVLFDHRKIDMAQDERKVSVDFNNTKISDSFYASNYASRRGMIFCRLDRVVPETTTPNSPMLARDGCEWILTQLNHIVGYKDVVSFSREIQIPYPITSLDFLHLELRYSVFIYEGKDLAVKDWSGSSDPYVEAFYVTGSEHGFALPLGTKTEFKRKTLNPVWNETRQFSREEKKPLMPTETLIGFRPHHIKVALKELCDVFSFSFKVFDHNRLTKDNPMGKALLKIIPSHISGINDATKFGYQVFEHEEWVQLSPQSGEKVSGKIRVGYKIEKLCHISAKALERMEH